MNQIRHDNDTLLLKVRRLGDGNVCHTGERTCFFRSLDEDTMDSKDTKQS